MRTILKIGCGVRRRGAGSRRPARRGGRSRRARRRGRPSASGRVRVVAAENFWGSIAPQIAGADADVTSIISNPDDRSARLRADAERRPRRSPRPSLVIENGIGYDPWAQQLRRRRADRATGRCSTSGSCSAWPTAATRTSGTRAASVANGRRAGRRRSRDGRPDAPRGVRAQRARVRVDRARASTTR